MKGVNSETVAEMLHFCHALAHENRLRILLLCLNAAHSVSDIVQQTGLSQSLVSHHLRVLKEAHLLRSERQGKAIHYALKDEHVKCIVTDLLMHAKGACS